MAKGLINLLPCMHDCHYSGLHAINMHLTSLPFSHCMWLNTLIDTVAESMLLPRHDCAL